MNVSIITTVDHNVGDDFVREGLKYLLKKKFSNKKIYFENIHKHAPVSVRYGFEKYRGRKTSKILDFIVPVSLSKDRIKNADLLVQSGAPVYWCHEENHCTNNEWYGPLIKKRFTKNKRAKLINLAAGTCQKYHSDGSEFCDSCNGYMREFYNLASVTTARDTLAKTALAKIGIEVPVIPCSSIFAIDEHGFRSGGDDYVVVNYMKGGAHYTLGQTIDFEKWESEFKKFYFDLKKRERVIISCHNQKELNSATKLDPDAEIFYKKDDYLAYMKFYAHAKFGIMNRVHGAFLMASYGKPSIIIGNDSRARMGEEIGLRTFFVNDMDSDRLNEQCLFLSSGADNYRERFNSIKQKAYDDYMEVLGTL